MNALSIRQRLSLIIIIALLSLVSVTIISLTVKRDNMLEERKSQIRVLVETTQSLVTRLYQQTQTGEISEREAQQRAITAIDAMRYGNNGYFMVFDMDANMVHHPISPDLNGKNLRDRQDVNGVYLFTEQVQQAKEGGGFVTYYWKKAGNDTKPHPKITYSLPFQPWGWVLSTGLYVDDVDAVFYQDVRKMLLLVAAIALVLAAISFTIARSITVPLSKLQTLLRTAERNLDLTVRSTLKGKNEITDLGRAFNNLMTAFEETLTSIAQGANQLNSEVSKLETLSNHIVGASTQQSEDTGSIAALVEEFAASINTISHDADKMKTLSNESGNKAKVGASTMQLTISNMDQMSEKSQRSSSAVAELDQHSKEIEGIISVINDVAEQTNLLALNAAIEAARAGDQGRGFAVVADEVRNLAVRTSDSTKQIASTIQELRNGIEMTVSHIEESVSVVSDNMSQTHTAEQSVREMHQKSLDLINIIEEVSRSLHEQTVANQELARRIQGIADMASNNHESAEDVQGSARQVNNLVSQFRQSVGRFKVSRVC
ncbi:methyl-accepting chemotaxis protein [Grimontia hollisae]|uniref:Methyl-accepting chemotaxis protein n=2 Tax=Grimontia hollisae TaxID=673 RepID=D0I9Q9_GRIHO|nr:methyl-accepting chemotaxis protein [Grimontia hollisae]AMG29004.1 methyl-accepting chemotaxis protein [Grimontia hollisae]EEY71774.1 methyl-accepting chemotaxis protein [Grimontia hollisae CIP 101886]MDF2184816.1 methyl-accepting chemotaxis protein [Grimontia hollisae]STO77086.1 Methyl-accepting chemotaxis protein 4 [Grimontia hollisae]STO98284.1 Methyl-accepting chemotaxis protein 4 [Grimontia hollisae]